MDVCWRRCVGISVWVRAVFLRLAVCEQKGIEKKDNLGEIYRGKGDSFRCLFILCDIVCFTKQQCMSLNNDVRFRWFLFFQHVKGGGGR